MPKEGSKTGNRPKKTHPKYEFSIFRKEESFTKQMGEQTLEKNPKQINQSTKQNVRRKPQTNP